MTDEAQTLAEDGPAPAPESTVVSDQAVDTPEVAETHEEQTQEEKKFTQAELDAMISKRLAREQRKWERESRQARVPTGVVSQAIPDEVLSVDQIDELVAQREIQKQRAANEDAYIDREEEARTKYDDFEQVAYNPKLRITDAMAETIKASDIGPDIAYWLGSNPKEADRISRLSTLLQAREIGKIEAKISSDPPQKKVSSAPAPLRPVTARAASSGVIDTTDPRSIKTLSTSEWIAAERQRQIAKVKASRNR